MTIAKREEFILALDEVYKNELKSVDLIKTDSKDGTNAGKIQVPKMSMDGLGDVGTGGSLSTGAVSLEYEEVSFNFNRGRRFVVDEADNMDNAQLLFAKMEAEFIRTKVVPEKDAFTFATICGKTGISKVASGATLSSGADVLAAIALGNDAMTDDEVSEEGRILYITPTLLGLVRDLDTTKSKELLASFEKIVKVPQSRFYTAIDQLDGTTAGETAGGYAKASGGKDINFLIVQKAAVRDYDKRTVSKIIDAEDNQDGDGFIQKYREYGLVYVDDNKVDGIYLHHKA